MSPKATSLKVVKLVTTPTFPGPAQTEARDDDRKSLARIACVLELTTGRMVWCASATDKRWGDLTTTTEARRAVEDLLSDL